MNGELLPLPVPKKLTIKLRPLVTILKDRTNTEGTTDAAKRNTSLESSYTAGLGDEVFLDDECEYSTSHESNPEDDPAFDVEKMMDKLYVNGDKEEDVEDAPDWEFEPHETRSKDATYVFCPAQHRRQMCHIHIKHFCQHPLLPGREGERTAEQIRTEAVFEMYTFCHQRGIADAWAYMWNSWYTPERWKLWARSTQPKYISRIRTTMNAENFWKQMKHGPLHNLLRPRLDQLTWLIIHRVIPDYLLRADTLEDGHRLGRSNGLTPYQSYFKTDWKELEKKPVSKQDYKTDITMWTCQCGQQCFNCHHLCKHLVHAVGKPPVNFWRSIIRRRTQPIYRHPAIQGPSVSPDVIDGSVTDGDDHDWQGDTSILEDSERWRSLLTGASDRLLGKRRRDSTPSEAALPTSDDFESFPSSPGVSLLHFTSDCDELEGEVNSEDEEEVGDK